MDFVAYSAAFNSHQNAIMHYGVRGMKWGVRKDAQLLAERKYNLEKKDLKQQFKLNKIDKTTYKNKKRRAKYEMLSAESRSKSFVKKNKKDAEVLHNKYMELHDKALKEIPNYKIKSGMKTAGRILGRIGTVSAVALAPFGSYIGLANAFQTKAISDAAAATLWGGASALGMGSAYVGSRKIRKGANAIRRKTT